MDLPARVRVHDQDNDILRFLPTAANPEQTVGPSLQSVSLSWDLKPAWESHRIKEIWSHGISSLVP